ncbi:hypothetical protein CDAR_208231 [Caerostris darwini]|uniref:Uncharacterized protein n=1 Tax=Caerostris darwini TaxID=1538125 RepID=A0AAV4MA37_9ARAC|nr:hypothetical protein CDAR_208231 [Caerostris darwini]
MKSECNYSVICSKALGNLQPDTIYTLSTVKLLLTQKNETPRPKVGKRELCLRLLKEGVEKEDKVLKCNYQHLMKRRKKFEFSLRPSGAFKAKRIFLTSSSTFALYLLLSKKNCTEL